MVQGVLGGDRARLAQAITLIESRARKHRAQARELFAALLPHAGKALRLGISGVPGAGKSTLVQTLVEHLVAQRLRVAVLSVDPSSELSGGSIQGDQTRMRRLQQLDAVFMRATPSDGTLGGVARKTREALLLCEAAGHDVVLVETVGVGQNEALVARLVDTFVLILLAVDGDHVQGIKRGVLELTDLLCVNKADGENTEPARQAAAVHRQTLRVFRPRHTCWAPEVHLTSGLKGHGIPELWARVEAHRAALLASGALERERQRQQKAWLWSTIEARLRASFQESPEVARELPALEAEVARGALTPEAAADTLLRLFTSPASQATQASGEHSE